MTARSMLAFLVWCVGFLASCGSDPTGPQGVRTRVIVGLHKTTGDPTVLEAVLRFDGLEIGRFSAAAPTDPVGLQGIANDVLPGQHVVEVLIVRQSASPTAYFINGSVFVGDRQIFLENTQAQVSTGQGLRVNVQI